MTTRELLMLVVLIVLVVGGLPAWHLHSYGYAPSGLVTLVILVLIVAIALRNP